MLEKEPILTISFPQFEGAGHFLQIYDRIECKNKQFLNLFGSDWDKE
jgi:hypothetical protein